MIERTTRKRSDEEVGVGCWDKAEKTKQISGGWLAKAQDENVTRQRGQPNQIRGQLLYNTS